MSDTPQSTPVLILGGGVAGLAAAVDLSRRGLSCVLAEREPVLGGRARDFCCKAVAACARCGACRLADLLAEASVRPQITIYTSALATTAQPRDRGWQVELAPAGPAQPAAAGPGAPLPGRLSLAAQAVILAVGQQPFDPAQKSSLGYGRVPGVISALELEARLALGAWENEPPPAKLAFIQCVGSRDQALGRLWCSRVCCGYALRLARLLKAGRPEMDIAFFHMDVQDYGRAWEEELAELRQELRFLRAMPGEVALGATGPEVVFALADGAQRREAFDLVVLSQGLGPPAGAAALAQMFGLARIVDGFLGQPQAPVAAGAPGVYVAGACRGPRSLAESIDHAGLAAAAAAAHVAQEAGRG
ncbi:MAG: FAD-dependent oxidoreductase [Thermodesulfobacteriota bacterium]